MECVHHWIAPDVMGPYPQQTVSERCRLCGRTREVNNRMQVVFGRTPLSDPLGRQLREDESIINMILCNNRNHQGFRRHGQYQRLERL